MTSDLQRRVYEHKQGLGGAFTKKYLTTRLVFYEDTNDVQIALLREKQIKAWLRSKKIDLVESMNPEWAYLSEAWYDTKIDPSHRSG